MSTISVSSLTSSLSSLSFSSHVSQKPISVSLSLTPSKTLNIASSRIGKLTTPLKISATALATTELETESLEKYVKIRLPGGFAAQTIFGTGRRKTAIARVVLQEGTGKFIINYRDATVSTPFLISFDFDYY